MRKLCRFASNWAIWAVLPGAFWSAFPSDAAEPAVARVVLLYQAPDGHPAATHEYHSGLRLLAKVLSRKANLQTALVQAPPDWAQAAETLESADAAVLFLAEGAKWLHADPARLQAFQAFSQRGGGLAALHWGLGTRAAEPVARFVPLFGACHGGPDRKYKVLEAIPQVAGPHAILRGVMFEPMPFREEYYYQLKRVPGPELSPLLQVEIEGRLEMVAWAYAPSGAGRAFGFTGLHFHENWRLAAYRRLVAQGVLWTLDRDIPREGIAVDVEEADFKLPERTQK